MPDARMACMELAEMPGPFIVDDIPAMIDFARRAFNAKVERESRSENGALENASLRIGDSKLVLSTGTARNPPRPLALHLYVEDVDGCYAQAVKAGARTLEAPANQFWGDRRAGVIDNWNNYWWLAMHIKEMDTSKLDSSHELAHQAKLGAGPGFIAGAIFAIMLSVLAAMHGESPLKPLYMFASLVLGSGAMQTGSVPAAVLGTVVTMILSTLYGIIFMGLNRPLLRDRGPNWPLQALLGAVFGAALWLINFQLFSRLLFPWLAQMPQLVLFVAHTLFFGVPLGFFCAERHSKQLQGEPA
jgi:PhnB protein